MDATQWTLISWIEGILPGWLITRKQAYQYQRLIIRVHGGIVESTKEPKELRPGCSLFIASMNILAIFKKTADPFYQAAYIYDQLANKGHYFVEGNKRTAHFMAKSHLFNEGYHFRIDYKYAVPFIEKIADGKKMIKETCRWLRKHSIKYQERTTKKYLNKLIKEIYTFEKRGRPKNDRKKF